jgi:hypothetical protein
MTRTDSPDKELQMQCRSLRHSWDFFTPVQWSPGYGLMTQARDRLHLRCLRCGTVRHDGYDKDGELLARRYDYPDDYKIDVDERPTTAQLRLWMVKRNRALQRQS